MEKNKLLPFSIIILAVSILFGSLWIGYSLKEISNKNTTKISQQSDILELSEAAKYLKLSESELLYLATEKGSGINYIKVGNKYIFSKEGLDKWVQSNRLEVQQ